MGATINVTCFVDNPQNIPPRLPTHQVTITLEDQGPPLPPPLGGVNFQEVEHVTSEMSVGGSANGGFSVDPNTQYWIRAEMLNDKSGFFGNWNDAYDVAFGILHNGPYVVADGGTITVTLTGILKAHQNLQ